MNYQRPTLKEYGSAASVTGIFGAESEQDESFDPNVNVVEEGRGTIDQCATPDGENCA
jgi:hypothetical protein